MSKEVSGQFPSMNPLSREISHLDREGDAHLITEIMCPLTCGCPTHSLLARENVVPYLYAKKKPITNESVESVITNFTELIDSKRQRLLKDLIKGGGKK